jgi:hypothetical protein
MMEARLGFGIVGVGEPVSSSGTVEDFVGLGRVGFEAEEDSPWLEERRVGQAISWLSAVFVIIDARLAGLGGVVVVDEVDGR